MAGLARWVVSISVCTLALAASAGCGGGEYRLAPASNKSIAADPAWDGAQAIKGVQVAARERDMRTLSPVTGQLVLSMEEAGGGLALGIAAPEAELEYLLLQVRYDATRWHVQSAQPAPELDGQSLMLGVAEAPGLYSLGLTGLRGAKLPALDEALVAVHLAAGPERNVSVAEPQCAITRVEDLSIEAGAKDTLLWSYHNTGDYDQNTEVNAADIVPIGAYYLEEQGSDRWVRARVADGDGNGEVSAADIVPIGANLLNSISGYAVYEGLSETGPWIDSGQRVPADLSTLPQGGGHKRFTHKIVGATSGYWYAVRAYFGETVAGSQSNPVEYGASDEYRPPRHLSARFDGSSILLTWDASAGTSPDTYRVYLSFSASFNIPWFLGTVEPAEELRFSVPASFSPEDEFYFAVTAVYGAQASPYSNIHHYGGSWEQVPPVWTGGAPNGGISSAKIYEDYAYITWYSAVDLISPPVRYYLYWAPSADGIDWDEPQYVTQGTTTRIITPLTAGVSYDFGVRAVDAVGNVTANTNTLTRIYSQ